MTEEQRSKLVLVVGPPRSGTSVTARILHEKIGICFGHNLVPGNAGNPKGFYEDSQMVAATLTKNTAIWRTMLEYVHSKCNKPRGVKTPELAFMEIRELQPDLIFRTCRSPIAIADSLERWYQPKPSCADALSMAVKYEKAIEEKLTGISCHVHRVDFYRQRDEGELEEELRKACTSVIQRIEGRTLNPEVVGSNPTGGTK